MAPRISEVALEAMRKAAEIQGLVGLLYDELSKKDGELQMAKARIKELEDNKLNISKE